MDIVVQKYGGTSMADENCINNVADRVIQTKRQNKSVVVVVSAPAGMTDGLIRKAKEITKNPDPREMDMLLSTGEQVSIALLAMAIEAKGEKAVSFLASQIGIITDSNHLQAKIQNIYTEWIIKALEEDKVVIIAGFQGISPEGEVTTLGRGGSDTTAVALAKALKVNEVEIYTDVDGIYTADPHIVDCASKVSNLSYDSMLEMAGAGAKVLDVRCVDLAKKNGITIHSRSSFVQEEGTRVLEEKLDAIETPSVSGIAHSKNKAKITIAGIENSVACLTKVFQTIAEAGINIDIFTQGSYKEGKVIVSYIIPEESYEQALQISEELVRDMGGDFVKGEPSVGKLSVIGIGMKNTPGVAAKVFQTLAAEKIETDMVSTSDINITCIVKKEDLNRAIIALHEAFGLS